MNTEWWYALVQAAPVPEIGERVNVGVLFGNGRPSALHFLEDLPRLEGVSTSAERQVYGQLLQDAAQRVDHGVTLEELRTRLGPQLVVAPLRALLTAPDDAIAKRLAERYLEAPAEDDVEQITRQQREVEQKLDRMMGRFLSAPGRAPLRRVTPAKIWGAHTPKALRLAKVPMLLRAIPGERADVLIDGVIMDPARIEESVKLATGRIGRAFWYYDLAKDDVLRETHRKVATVGFLLNGSKLRDRTLEDARAYVKDVWEQHASMVIDARHPSELTRAKARIDKLLR